MHYSTPNLSLDVNTGLDMSLGVHYGYQYPCCWQKNTCLDIGSCVKVLATLQQMCFKQMNIILKVGKFHVHHLNNKKYNKKWRSIRLWNDTKILNGMDLQKTKCNINIWQWNMHSIKTQAPWSKKLNKRIKTILYPYWLISCSAYFLWSLFTVQDL